MILNLLAVSLNDQPLSQPIAARFDGSGGTIGRADHNTLALPDPERHISRVQAEVVLAGGGFLIRNDAAARNPIVVGSRTLGPGEAAPLAHADPVRVGGYLLEVRIEDGADADRTQGRSTGWPSVWNASPVAPAASASLHAPTPRPPAATPWAAVPAPPAVASSNPFAGLLGPATPQTAPRSPEAAAGTRLPDDFDPFTAPAGAVPSRPMPLPADPFAGLGLEAPAASIDRAFDLGGGSDDPLAAFMASAAAPGEVSTDPLVLVGGAAPPPRTPPLRVQRDDLPALHDAYVPPRVQAAPTTPAARPPAAAPVRVAGPAADSPAQAAPVPAARPPAWPRPGAAQASPQALAARAVPAATAPAGASTPTSPSDADLWQAFCAGAGVDLALPPAARTAALHDAGRMLRSAVEGALQLIAVRATTKHELRAEVTQIRPRSNNPLKFSPDATAAVQQLLQPAARGFLEGPAAMEDAMRDLVGHSIGTVAGMRAAIEGMLDRFDPAALQAKLGADSMLDKLLPMNRSARLWDLYVEHHRRIRDDAQGDFHTLFGKAFLAAYQQQVQRLARASSPPPPPT